MMRLIYRNQSTHQRSEGVCEECLTLLYLLEPGIVLAMAFGCAYYLSFEGLAPKTGVIIFF